MDQNKRKVIMIIVSYAVALVVIFYAVEHAKTIYFNIRSDFLVKKLIKNAQNVNFAAKCKKKCAIYNCYASDLSNRMTYTGISVVSKEMARQNAMDECLRNFKKCRITGKCIATFEQG